MASLVSVYKSLVIPQLIILNISHSYSQTFSPTQFSKTKLIFVLDHCNEQIMSLLQCVCLFGQFERVVVTFRWMADNLGRSQTMLAGLLKQSLNMLFTMGHCGEEY